MEDYFVIGDVVNTQGSKGEVRVIPCTDDESRFELLDSVFLEQRGKMTEYYIENVRYHKQFVLLKFEGVDDMTTAEKLKGATVDSHLDHRVAMSCAIAALVAEGETTILDSDCVAISFPNFYELLETL